MVSTMGSELLTTPVARRGLVLILSSPSGAGKTTLTRALARRPEWGLELSVSVTTRWLIVMFCFFLSNCLL